MKELVCSKIEVLFVLLSSMLTCAIGHMSLTSNKVKTLSPFKSESSETELDNDLSGNSGISEDYYAKQVRQFLNNKGSYD
jgi:hypothetical protein